MTCCGEHLMVKCIWKREKSTMVLVAGMCIQSTFKRTFPPLKWILLLEIPSGSAAPFLTCRFSRPLVEKSGNILSSHCESSVCYVETFASFACACHLLLYSFLLRFTSTSRVGFTVLLRCCWACRMTWL